MRQAVRAPADRARLGGPWWRALLESRWRNRLQEVTELSLAFHDAAAAAPAGKLGPLAHVLLERAAAARRALADTDEALARLAAGRFGQCEDCADTIPARTLRARPEARYCARCSGGAALALARPASPRMRSPAGRVR